ncbi:MAG: hypothetical protein GY862_16185, partial [Gammaproteobacteria bacterium]|nr:hypothetical protein [Gammaproteobacteria bacterium]
HLGGKLSDRELEARLQVLEYGDLIARPGLSRFRYCGIPDDILDLIFRDLYQEEIDLSKPDIESELMAKAAALEKDNKTLQGMVNELKGRVPEFMVYRELNKYRKKYQPIKNLRQRLRPCLSPSQTEKMENMLAEYSVSPIDTVWLAHYIQLPETMPVEVDVLAEGSEADISWAFVFEIKNRTEKNLPSMTEARGFIAKTDKVRQHLARTGKTVRFV